MVANFGLGGFEGEFVVSKLNPAWQGFFGRVGKRIVFWVGGSEGVLGSGVFIDSELVGRSPGGGFVNVGNIDGDVGFGVKGRSAVVGGFDFDGDRLVFFVV